MNHTVNFTAFRNDVEKALTEVAQKYNLNLKAGKITYDENTFTMQLKAERSDVNVEQLQFASNAEYMQRFGYDFHADDYEKEFTSSGRQWKLIGFKPGNKWDVIVKDVKNGKQYKMQSSGVLRALGRKTA